MSYPNDRSTPGSPMDEDEIANVLPSTNVDMNMIIAAMHKLSVQDTDVTDVLTDCEIYLNNLDRFQLYEVAKFIDMNLIFDCLNTTDPKQLLLSCVLIEKLLTVLPPKYALFNYAVSVERSLNHPSNVVKEKILNTLSTTLTFANVEANVDENLLSTIVDCLKHDDISVSCNAAKCLQRFQIPKVMSSLPVLSKFQSIMSMNASMRSRVYDLLLYWSTNSKSALTLISSKGLFLKLVEDITSEDTMMQMVTIKMLIPFSITDHGFDYLNTTGILSVLYRFLSSYQKDDFSSVGILYPSVLEFFIQVTEMRPKFIYTSYPKVFFIIYEILKQVDDAFISTAMNGIVSLASSWDCKLVLDIPFPNINCYDQVERDLDMWSLFIIELSHIASGNRPDLRTEAIQAIAQIIKIEDDNNLSKSFMIERTHKWYKQMQEDPIKMISQVIVLPFFNIKMAGLEMLLALAQHPWGQEEINRNPIILDTVIKNCPDEQTLTRELKQSILATLSRSSTAKDIFTADRLLQIINAAKSNVNLIQPEVLIENVAM